MISLKSVYALTAVVYLAEHANANPLPHISTIASVQNIPQQYLAQIMALLRRAGVVKSTRGVGGGYALMKLPENLTVYDVLKAVEGNQLAIVSRQYAEDEFGFLWDELRDAIFSVLSRNVADIVKSRQKRRQYSNYSI